jgi:predicted Fe-S protein YdhL (DUF1289 family)
MNDFNGAQQHLTTQISILNHNFEETAGSKRSLSQATSSGRGGGGGGGSSKKQKSGTYKGTLENKRYHFKEWWSMTDSQRATVLKLRAKESKRTVKATNTQEISDSESEADKSKNQKNAGGQFGSAAHKKKKED